MCLAVQVGVPRRTLMMPARASCAMRAVHVPAARAAFAL